MNARLKKLACLFPSSRLDAYLVTSAIDIYYLTGYRGSDSWLLVFPRSAEYITDARYTEEARAQLSGIRVCQAAKSLSETLGHRLGKRSVRRVGFDERHLSLALYKKISAVLPSGTKLIAANGWVEQQRICKDRQEIVCIKKAISINKQAYRSIKPHIRPGVTEQGLLERLERFIRREKVKFAFDPIVASGPRTAFPHAKVTERRLGRQDQLLLDLGIEFEGYKSDLTRMFFLGKIPPLVKKAEQAVLQAQRAAIEMVRPGILAAEIDQQARKVLCEKKLDRYFTHSLGHGVGLEIHEAPRISFSGQTILREGMVFTVEPAVYFPQQFGIRIEDMVLVTKQGYELLS